MLPCPDQSNASTLPQTPRSSCPDDFPLAPSLSILTTMFSEDSCDVRTI